MRACCRVVATSRAYGTLLLDVCSRRAQPGALLAPALLERTSSLAKRILAMQPSRGATSESTHRVRRDGRVCRRGACLRDADAGDGRAGRQGRRGASASMAWSQTTDGLEGDQPRELVAKYFPAIAQRRRRTRHPVRREVSNGRRRADGSTACRVRAHAWATGETTRYGSCRNQTWKRRSPREPRCRAPGGSRPQQRQRRWSRVADWCRRAPARRHRHHRCLETRCRVRSAEGREHHCHRAEGGRAGATPQVRPSNRPGAGTTPRSPSDSAWRPSGGDASSACSRAVA